jgi:hypothetical protein
MTKPDSIDVKLAVYVERLDRYIETQSALNSSLINSFKSIETDVADIQVWKSKMYGMKTGLVAVGFLIVHLVVIIGTLTGINWNNR